MTLSNHFKIIFPVDFTQQIETQTAEMTTSLQKPLKNYIESTTTSEDASLVEVTPELFFMDSQVPSERISINSNTILVPTTSESNGFNELLLKKEETTWSQTLLDLIRRDTFETGYSTDSERFFKTIMDQNSDRAKQWVNKMFLVYFHNKGITVGLLSIMAHMKYNVIQPQGPTMAVAGLSHKDAEVREVSIRCFENWGDTTSLNILRNLRCSEQWLKDYLKEVIEDLEEVQGKNVVTG